VLGEVLGVPAAAAAKSANAQGLVLAGQALAQILTLPVMALIVTLLYFSLRTEREEPAPAPGGEPDADPFARRRAEGWEPPV
jgi:hypothetical protein